MASNAPESQPNSAETKPEEEPNAATQNGDPEVLPEAIAPGPEPKLPTRKDMSLREFLAKMDDYAPIVSSTHFLFHSG